MNRFILLCSLMAANIVTAQQDGPKAAVDTFFDAFHAKDTVKMKTVFAEGMVLHSISEGHGKAKLSRESADDLLKSIAIIPASVTFEERLLSYEIQTDGAMATVWTPYEFYYNGAFSHSGVNSFQLFRDGDVWKIVHIIDTRRKG